MQGCRQKMTLGCLAVLVACWCAQSACAKSFGPWNLPTNWAQYCGYSFGAGHHAPIVRTPHCQPLHVQRVAVVPSSQLCGCQPICSSCGPMYYGHGGHCGTQSPPCHPQVGRPFPDLAKPQGIFAPPAQPESPARTLNGDLPSPEMPKADPISRPGDRAARRR